MKYTGFISEIDEYAFAKSLNKYYLKGSAISPNRELVIAYLKTGALCVAFMGIAEDEDEARMGNISVLTDGEWFWPAYFANFLEKYPSFRINSEFERHVLQNQAKKISIDDDTLATLEKEFLAKTRFK